MAQTSSLRTFVNVPQTFMSSIVPGMSAELLVREFPGRTFAAQVAGASGALDPASRTLLTEVRTRNDGDVLRPGMYADVRFHLQRERPPLLIPTSARIIRAGGPRVAIVVEVTAAATQLVRRIEKTCTSTTRRSSSSTLAVSTPS